MPRLYSPFSINRSHSEDEIAQPSTGTSKSRSVLYKKDCQPPHRLSDNLHWRCSSCNSQVSTSETGAHLISCLMDIVVPFIDPKHSQRSTSDINLSLTSNGLMSSVTANNSVTSNSSSIKRALDRPRTKKLERPTPNIRHPVIDSDDLLRRGSGPRINNNQGNNNNNNLRSNINSLDLAKCKLTNRPTNGSINDRSKTCSTVNNQRGTAKKVCNSCERSSAPERLHSHANIKGKLNKKNDLTPTPSMAASPEQPQAPTANDDEDADLLMVDCVQSPGNLDDNCEDESENKSSPESNSQPLSLLMKCYLCRQQFGTDEMESHEIECLEKWKRENSGLSPSQRVPVAAGAEHRGSFSSISGCDPEGWEHFKSQLTPCPKCSRTFFPHRLAAHERACRGPQQPGKGSNRGQGQVHSTVHNKSKSSLIQCSKCSKKLPHSSMKIHLLSCNKQP